MAISTDSGARTGRRSGAFLDSLLNHTLDAVISIDATGHITSMNHAAEGMFSYTESEALGKNVTLLMPDSYARHHDHSLAEYLRSGVAHVVGIGREVRGLRRDGSEFPLDIAVSEFSFEGRRYFTGILRDITEDKRLERQLQQAQKMEAVGQLASGIAHDFNNILMVIQSHCYVLLSALAPEDSRRHSVDEICQASDHAAALIRQLLALSRREILELRDLDLHEVVANLESMLRTLIGENIELAVSLAATRRRVRIDAGLMEQVLLNLAANARDAMPGGGRLTIETRDLDQACVHQFQLRKAGQHVLLSVSDTGCGMDSETQSRVFDPFFTTKNADKGTGLGLAMVQGIVSQFGGSIEIQSRPGVGSSFEICLPVSENEAGESRE